MASDQTMTSLMECFGLTEREWKKEIRKKHLQRIQCYCRHWKKLIPYLSMEDITEYDIEHGSGSPKEKRQKFLSNWKQEKGSEATYEKLAIISKHLQTLRYFRCPALPEFLSSQIGLST